MTSPIAPARAGFSSVMSGALLLAKILLDMRSFARPDADGTDAAILGWADGIDSAFRNLFVVDEELARRVHNAYFADSGPSEVELACMLSALRAALGITP